VVRKTEEDCDGRRDQKIQNTKIQNRERQEEGNAKTRLRRTKTGCAGFLENLWGGLA
jgi:hypothetical protein